MLKILLGVFLFCGISGTAHLFAADKGKIDLFDDVMNNMQPAAPVPAPAKKTPPAPASAPAAVKPAENSQDSNAVQIIKAEFGIDKGMKDVTETAKTLVKNGKLRIWSLKAQTFGEAPGNPKNKTQKKLKLTYKYEGAENTVTINEGADLFIPPLEPDFYSRDQFNEFHEDLSYIDFDSYGFPYYTGTVFPEAQEAVYSDNKFIPMNDVSVVLGGDIKKDDMRIAVLTRKLEKWGAKIELTDKITDKKTQILLNVPGYGISGPDKPEAYSISCTEKNGIHFIAVNAKDKRGLLWGIVSVIQLTRHDNLEPAMLSAEIRDYPEHLLRGMLSDGWGKVYELMIFAKLNCVVMQIEPFEGHGWCWRMPGPPKMGIQRLADIMYALGLDYYTKIHPAESTPKFIASNEKDIEHMVWLIKKYYASKHMNLYWAYDDIRFPAPPQDKKHFGSFGKADAYAVQRVFTEVRKEYPDFKMVFCPPYYWTNGIYRSQYGESGVEYVKECGRVLDPSIGIFWTGPQVASYRITQDSVKEISAWIGRKPWIFKNRPGDHMGNRSLPTDGYYWPSMGYPTLLDDVELYGPNTMGSPMATVDGSIAEYTWNTKKYEIDRSSARAACMIFGPEAFDYMKVITKNLDMFDNYATPPDVPRASAVSAMNYSKLDAAMTNARAALAEVRKVCKNNAIGSLSSYGEMLGWSDACLTASKSPSLLASLPAYSVKAQAIKEAAYNDKKDLFFTVDSLWGGFARGFMKVPVTGDERYVKTIYGNGTQYSSLSANFTTDPFPPSNDYEIYICGRVFAKNGEDCKMTVSVNGKTVYEGPSKLGKADFAVAKILVPMHMLEKAGNFTISNSEKSSEIDTPCIAVSYVIIRKL